MSVFWSDACQPRSFTELNDRKWAFLETTPNLFDQLDDIKQKFHCDYQLNAGEIDGKRQVYRAMFNCNAGDPNCTFALMAGKTEQGRFHIYLSGQHTCCHANDVKTKILATQIAEAHLREEVEHEDNDGVTRKQLAEIITGNALKLTNKRTIISDANPPRNITTQNGRVWIFMKSLNTNKKKLREQLLDATRRKYNCYPPLRLHDNRTVYRVTFYCRTALTKCDFRLLALRTDREGHYHLYASGKHTCRHGKRARKTRHKRQEEKDEEEEDEEEEEDNNEAGEEKHERMEEDEKMEEGYTKEENDAREQMKNELDEDNDEEEAEMEENEGDGQKKEDNVDDKEQEEYEAKHEKEDDNLAVKGEEGNKQDSDAVDENEQSTVNEESELTERSQELQQQEGHIWKPIGRQQQVESKCQQSHNAMKDDEDEIQFVGFILKDERASDVQSGSSSSNIGTQQRAIYGTNHNSNKSLQYMPMTPPRPPLKKKWPKMNEN